MSDGRLIVVGGGAAGVFCAVNAARMAPGLRVLVLEKGPKLLSKVRVSGGGRCNVTHACDDPEVMSRSYPRSARFMRKALHHFSPPDTVRWFGERGLPLVTEADGRMFPVTNRSESVIRCLLEEAERYGVVFRTGSGVGSVKREGGRLVVGTADGEKLEADAVCIACGGFPKEGQFGWIRDLGHSVVPPVPSLFTFNMPGDPITALAGVSVADVAVRIPGMDLRSRGPLLVTHWGLSGPAVLTLSAWGARLLHDSDYRFELTVNWCPDFLPEMLAGMVEAHRSSHGSSLVHGRQPFQLPSRLWTLIADGCGIGRDTRWAELPSSARRCLLERLGAQRFRVQGKTTYKEEFVTAGGVPTSEVDHATMQSRKFPGVYFAGEILDVDGVTGGYNFQHAWTSGWLAARDIARRLTHVS